VFLLAIGVALFGTVTGYVANLFLSPRKRRSGRKTDAERRLDDIEELRGGVDDATSAVREKVAALRADR
jgi:hypothetical protein